MKRLFFISLFMLAGCQTAQLVPQYTMPDPPKELMQPPQKLKPIQKLQ